MVTTVDYHTAGEPFRIVPEPGVDIAGVTVADRRMSAIDDPVVDGLRKLLCFEPRGHADMYGGLIVPPDDDGAHLGVLFWHKDGFSTACGHGTIALGAWAIDAGLVPIDPSGSTEVRIDVPSGRVTARVQTIEGRPAAIDFVSVPSQVLHQDVPVATSRGELTVDVAYGGAIYAHLDAGAVGLEVTPEHLGDLIAIGREVKWAVNAMPEARHPTDDRLSGIYGTILYDDLGVDDEGRPHQRNVTIFADGQVDRSPCGSGTASRLAVLHADGLLQAGEWLVHDSIVGSRFLGRVVEASDTDGHEVVVPEVRGTAHRTGTSTFELDPHDELGVGFVLR